MEHCAGHCNLFSTKFLSKYGLAEAILLFLEKVELLN
jgi:hypothetical protein